MALICKREKVVPLLIIMAAKTEQPQALSKAYAATLAMNRWQRLRTIELGHFFSPHDPETIKEIFKDTVWELKKTELIDEYIKFKSTKRLKKFINSWMGGFEFVAQMPPVEQKQLIKDVVKNYKKEVPVADDGSVEWRSARLVVHAEKPKKNK